VAGTYTVAEVVELGWEQVAPGGSGKHVVTVGAETEIRFDFEELAHQGDHVAIGAYQRDGFTLDVPTAPTDDQWLVYGPLSTSRYTGSATLTPNWSPSTCRMGKDDGGTFTVDSIDLSKYWTGSPPTDVVTFYGTRAGSGPVTQTFDLDHFGLVTYQLDGFTDILSLEWYYGSTGERQQIDNVVVQTAAPWVATDLNFGNRSIVGEIHGTKFNDLDGDGVRDAGEPGLQGVTIFIDEDEDGIPDAGEPSAVTDVNGDYVIPEVIPGTHTVAEVVPANWAQTYPSGTHSVVVGPSETVTGVDFGNLGVTGEIRGTKWEDLDADGVRDAGEPVLADWEIYLDTDANGQHDPGEPITITAADGSYAFMALEPGDYIVAEVRQDGWQQSAPNAPPPGLLVTVVGGEITTGVDFGNWRPAEIHGTKWDDTNGDAVWDAGELPMAGVTVYLDLDEDGELDAGEPSTVTLEDDPGTPEDETGTYAFTGLTPGRYVVGEVVPEGWRQTAPQTGGLGGQAEPDQDLVQLLLKGLTTTASDAPVYVQGEVVEGGPTVQTNRSGPLIRMDEFRADPRFAGIDGAGFAAVVLDTGIDRNHFFFGPDADGNGLADRIVYEWDYYYNDSNASDGDGHGSNVTSIVASEDAMYTGMAPAADIIALKVLSDSGSGTFSDVEEALQWVVANALTYNIVSVNMSLGDGGNYTAPLSLYGLGDEMQALADLGVFVVSASGNSFYSKGSVMGVAYPSADPNSLSIGAVYTYNAGGFTYSSGARAYSTDADRIAPFSQRHNTMTTVFAPGAPITGANAYGGTVTYHGTSQASPHVAGIAVLAQDLAETYLGRRLTESEFVSLLRDTAVTIHDGDDEDDNVVNTGRYFPRVDMFDLAEAIWSMADPPGTHAVQLEPGDVATGLDFGNHEILPFEVAACDPPDGATYTTAPQFAVVDFSLSVDTNSLDADDLTINGVGCSGYTVLDGDTVQFQLPALGEGTYELAVAAGSILAFDLTPVAPFTSSFRVDADDVPVNPFVGVVPAGSLTSVSDANTGTINDAADQDTFQFWIEGTQTLMAVVYPDDPAATLCLELVSAESGIHLGPTGASAPGEPVVLGPVSVDLDGAFDAIVRGDVPVGYELEVWRNAVKEISDSADGAELPIDGSLVEFGSGRYGVVGNGDPGPGAGSGTRLIGVRWSNSFTAQNTFEIDPVTGTGAALPGATGYIFLNSLASDLQGTLWSQGTAPGFVDYLLTIDPTTGVATAGPLLDLGGDWLDIKSMAVSPSGQLYGMEFNDNLFVIDTSTGVGTHIGKVGVPGYPIGIQGMAFAPDGTLYGWGVERYGLITIDPHTAAYADVSPTGGPSANVLNLAVAADGTLYGARNYLYTIDRTTGVPTQIGTGDGFDDLRGIDFVGPGDPDVDEYTLDLTGKSGHLLDVVLDGIAGADFSDQTLELLDLDGETVLRTAVADPLGALAENYQLAILDFVVPSDGVYTLQFTSEVEGQYGILVTEDLTFDTEPNGSAGDALRSLDVTGAALGALSASDPADSYALALSAHEPSITVWTETPVDDPRQPEANLLDPALSVYGPDGQLVAGDDNSAPDGKNASFTFVIPQAGQYRVEVQAAGASEG